MEGKETNFEKTVDNLYYRAERAGTLKFGKEEFIQAYKKYSLLISERSAAIEKTRTFIHRFDDKETKKYKKAKIKEGKKETEKLDKALREVGSILNPMMEQFDLQEIGGSKEAKMMLQRAEHEDIKERRKTERQIAIEKISPKAVADDKKAAEKAAEKGKTQEETVMDLETK